MKFLFFMIFLAAGLMQTIQAGSGRKRGKTSSDAAQALTDKQRVALETANEENELLLKHKEELQRNKDESPIEYLTPEEARKLKKNGILGYLRHYGPNGQVWRTKNTDMILSIVYDHDFSKITPEDNGVYIPPENRGYTVYQSADGVVSFIHRGSNGRYRTTVNLPEPKEDD